MDDQAFQKYLEERYKPQIAWYSKQSRSSKKWYSLLQWGLIVLAALSPILIALGGPITTWERGLALTVAVLVAILSSVLKTFRYEENWLNYRTTSETLKKEIHYYTARIDPYQHAENPKTLFVERVEALISRENTLWLATHQPEQEKGEGSHPHT